MKILVLNCGSSSLKYQVFDMQEEKVLAKGIAEKLGLNDSFITYQKGQNDKKHFKIPELNHAKAITYILHQLENKEDGILNSLHELMGVGHRVVHGGTYTKSLILTQDVIEGIKKAIALAPLHNPAHLEGIEAINEMLPNISQVAVFDTSFHQTLDEEAYLYPLPTELYEKHRIRKYGFHGTSHRYVSSIAAEFLSQDISKLKIVSAHLGNGSSLAAIKYGQCIDTSMGLTPLEGLMMGTRCGSIDPSVALFLQDQLKYTTQEINHLFNKQSGLLGVSGLSFDMRDIEMAMQQKDVKATLAFKMLIHRILHFIGAYHILLEGMDVLIFTAGIGENSPLVREAVLSHLGFMGVKFDQQSNLKKGELIELSTPDSKIKVLVVPTNEELMIARDTLTLLQ